MCDYETCTLYVELSPYLLKFRSKNGHDFDDPDWQQILKRFLYFAYEQRAVCIVTLDCIGEELPNAKKIPRPKLRWFGPKHWYWMGFTHCCSKALLDKILESSAFEHSELDFTSIENSDLERCISFIDEMETDPVPSEKTREMLHLNKYGREVYWSNPPEAIKEQLESVVRAIAEKVGWDVVVERTDQAEAEKDDYSR